jgi:hypothetical protein
LLTVILAGVLVYIVGRYMPVPAQIVAAYARRVSFRVACQSCTRMVVLRRSGCQRRSLACGGLANLAAKSDPKQARQWLEQAAEAGEPFAINILSSRQKRFGARGEPGLSALAPKGNGWYSRSH